MSESDLVKLRLAAEGFGGGDPERVGKMRADWVVKSFQYLQFKAEYEDVFLEMNKGA